MFLRFQINPWIAVATVLTCLLIIGPITIYIVFLREALEYNYVTPRTKADMRSLASAIESYRVEYGNYPPHTFEPEYKLAWQGPANVPTFDRRCSLSTPINFVRAMPADNFHQRDAAFSTFAYFSNYHGWLLISRGPDRDFDLPFAFLRLNMVWYDVRSDGSVHRLQGPEAAGAMMAHFSYDSSNGSDSSGDLFHFSEGGRTLPWMFEGQVTTGTEGHGSYKSNR